MNQTRDREENGTIRLQIDEVASTSPTIFIPQTSIEKRDSSNTDSISPSLSPPIRAPEKKLTLFALRLAILEKAATGLGTLGFIWATVVLLGGFAIKLDKTDFWFVTIILLIEGTRIFSRSQELEWQHQATWSIADVGINSFRAIKSSSHVIIKTMKTIFKPIGVIRKQGQSSSEIVKSTNRNNWDQDKTPTRMWEASDVPLLPYAQWVFLSRNISKILYWLQLASATACSVLSLMKLIRQDFGEVEKGDTDKRNRHSALIIFYSLALAEALLFLLEKAYWEWKVIHCKLLDKVNEECGFGPRDVISIRRFFYDAYSRCVNGSIFDGLEMDMVSFAMELLSSNSPDEQLIGVRILKKLALNELFCKDTLQKIGINLPVMERLVEMLNWKDPQQEEIRESAAEILSKLAGKKQNSLRVAGIPGAVESISSLLQNYMTVHVAPDHPSQNKNIHDHVSYSFWKFNHLGLLILKKLARDHDNCGKIGNTRGLLPKIIDFTHAGERLLKDETVAESQILTVKRSLQVLKMLASTTGDTGKHLRKEISEVVFTISNIRDILRYGEKHPILQQLGIEILTCLALEEDATERIGETGGVLKELFNIFFTPENQNHVRIAAGEALAMLALESKRNCNKILNLKVTEKLVESLEATLLRIDAARILTHLCKFTGDDSFTRLKGITAAAPTVLRSIMSGENNLQEVMIGLGAQVFKFMPSQETSIMFKQAGISETALATKLVQILKKYPNPTIKTPRIRRFVIELSIWMMIDNETNIEIFKKLGMKKELECVAETTSELESFNVFSGTVGLSRHTTTILTLVDIAMNLMKNK